MKDFDRGKIAGMIVWVAAITALVIVAIYVLMWMANPMFERVGETIGNASRALNIGSGDDFHSLAVLCIVCIFIIGLVKVLTRKR